MRAAVIRNGRIGIEERPDPVAGEGELLIRVRAAGINRADLLQVAGAYPPPAGIVADVPGLECAGEAVATGERVLALLGGGGHAELVVVPERHTLPVPGSVEWPSAGGFMEAFATAHDALFTQAGLRSGERLLVNGAAGGVGVAAVQLGLAAGAEVTGTARSNADCVSALGAGIEPDGEYDVILELVGGDNLSADVQRLAPGGRMIVIGTGAGSKAEIDFGRLMQRRARIQSSTLRSRTVEEKAVVVDGLRRDVLPLLASGRLTVPVHETFPLAAVQQAYDAFAAGGKFGKLVLTI